MPTRKQVKRQTHEGQTRTFELVLGKEAERALFRELNVTSPTRAPSTIFIGYFVDELSRTKTASASRKKRGRFRRLLS